MLLPSLSTSPPAVPIRQGRNMNLLLFFFRPSLCHHPTEFGTERTTFCLQSLFPAPPFPGTPLFPAPSLFRSRRCDHRTLYVAELISKFRRTLQTAPPNSNIGCGYCVPNDLSYCLFPRKRTYHSTAKGFPSPSPQLNPFPFSPFSPPNILY